MNDGRKQSQRARNEDGYKVGHGRFEGNVKRGAMKGTRFSQLRERKKWTALLKRSVGCIQDMACMGEGVCSDDRVVNQ